MDARPDAPAHPTSRPSWEALDRFTAAARALAPATLGFAHWDDVRWWIRIERSVAQRGQPAVRFTVGHARDHRTAEPLPEPFASFARAAVCHWAHARLFSISPAPFYMLNAALRALHAASDADLRRRPGFVGDHFTRAEVEVGARCSPGFAEQVAMKLDWLAQLADRFELSDDPLEWKRSTRSNGDDFHDGPRQLRRSGGFLLSDQELLAWARMSAAPPSHDWGKILQRAVDLMVCGGFRVGEVCTLPADALVREVVTDGRGRPVRDADGRRVVRVGLRHWPEKGNAGQSLVKWLPTAMGPIAVRAVGDLLRLTAHARASAEAHHEGRCPLAGTPMEGRPDGHEITVVEFAALSGYPASEPYVVRKRLRKDGVPHREGTYVSKRNGTQPTDFIELGHLRTWLRKLTFLGDCVPNEPGFHPLHECLLVMPARMRSGSNGVGGTARPVNATKILNYLQGSPKSASPMQQAGLTDHSGAPVSIVPSQFRHWINTAACEGYLNQLDLAHWMGRTTLRGNRPYDLRTPEARTAALERFQIAHGLIERPSPTIVRPLRRAEPAFETDATGHATLIGTCSHDYRASPCDAYVASLASGTFAEQAAGAPTGEREALEETLRGLARRAAREGFEEPWAAIHDEARTLVAAAEATSVAPPGRNLC